MKKLYRNDLILNLIIILICIAVPITLSVTSHDEDKTAIISVDGVVAREIPLTRNEDVCFEGVFITVNDGKASVTNADCPDGLCMKMKEAKNVGDSIICVPNKVSVRIVGHTDGEGADVIAG
ncbi:MAG: NusG domain II-containing protein [Clostridia bacterium]|nr:NusG domain II-containing protein [Clostridia bacterium]MBQ8758201.1 NusG domain II-containing protein [Clostridia bacterium]